MILEYNLVFHILQAWAALSANIPAVVVLKVAHLGMQGLIGVVVMRVTKPFKLELQSFRRTYVVEAQSSSGT
jgi:hypothetical protein